MTTLANLFLAPHSFPYVPPVKSRRLLVYYIRNPLSSHELTLLIRPVEDGTSFMGQRLTVQFARGSRQREGEPGPGGYHDRPIPRPRRTQFRMQITGLPIDTSWQVCLAHFPSVLF